MSRPSRRMVLAGLGTLLTGCTAPGSRVPTTNRDRGTTTSGRSRTVTPGSGATVTPKSITVGYPHLRASGNRIAAGGGALPDTDPIDCSLDAPPTWLTAVSTEAGSTWAVVDQSGTLSLVAVQEGDASVTETDAWPADRPAVVRKTADGPSVVVPPAANGQLSPPLVLGNTVLAVDTNGQLAVATSGDRDVTLDMDLLPDGRLCRLDERRVVTLGGPTTRYDHGALGDSTEASEIVVIDVGEGLPMVERRISIPQSRVVEGLKPIVTDLGGDRAIVVTESDTETGARLVAYAPDGTKLASGEPVGTGFRWRHQLAVAPFGPSGERELAVVKTPHIGGTVEFYRRRGASLDIVAAVEGASSHAIGSRNLDGAVAADADGDDRTELVVPTDDRTALRGIERRGDQAVAEWSVPTGGTLSSNVVGVGHGDGLAIGVGTTSSTLRVWPPA